MILPDLDFSHLEDDIDLVPTTKDNRERFPCSRCGGDGVASFGLHLQHRGKCHSCNGKGYFLTSPKQRKDASASRGRSRVKKADAAAVRAEQWKLDNAELHQWMMDNRDWNSFAHDMVDVVTKYGALSENQHNAIVRTMDKCIAGKQERNATRQVEAAAKRTIDLSKIRDLFDIAISHGLKKPAFIIGGLRISIAPAHGKNAGWLYVKDNGEYAGKISAEGKFYGIRDHRVEIEAELVEMARNPAEAAMAHGRETGNCSCCGRLLTDPNSIELGIGPICAGNWGF